MLHTSWPRRPLDPDTTALGIALMLDATEEYPFSFALPHTFCDQF